MTDEKAGSQGRLVEAFHRDRRRLTRFVEMKLWRAGDADAEDIVSDVFLRLVERGDMLGQVEDITAYLYRALAHAVSDFFRRRRNGSAYFDDDGDAAQNVADPLADPLADLLRSEQRQRIADALAQLSPPERAVWVAVEIQGRTFRELSDLWNEPLGTLLSRKSRATRRLRRLLSDPTV